MKQKIDYLKQVIAEHEMELEHYLILTTFTDYKDESVLTNEELWTLLKMKIRAEIKLLEIKTLQDINSDAQRFKEQMHYYQRKEEERSKCR